MSSPLNFNRAVLLGMLLSTLTLGCGGGTHEDGRDSSQDRTTGSGVAQSSSAKVSGTNIEKPASEGN
jgi:uncharacterized spore protein YtfJ